jgi:hypothetical protein
MYWFPKYIHKRVVPGPVLQDEVYKCVYALPSWQCRQRVRFCQDGSSGSFLYDAWKVSAKSGPFTQPTPPGQCRFLLTTVSCKTLFLWRFEPKPSWPGYVLGLQPKLSESKQTETGKIENRQVKKKDRSELNKAKQTETCCMSQYMLCLDVHVECLCHAACSCRCCMSISLLHEHEDAAQTWICSMDMDM